MRRLAERLDSKTSEHITEPAWLRMRARTMDEAHAEAFPAALQPAKGFKTSKGNEFNTYARAFILGRLYALHLEATR